MKKVARFVSVVLFLFFGMFWVISIWESIVSEEEPQPYEEYYTEGGPGCDEFIEDVSDGAQRNIQRFWEVYYDGSTYCAQYISERNDKRQSEQFRDMLQVYWQDDYVLFWHTLYKALYKNDVSKLSFLQDSLTSLANGRGLSKTEFAYLIVSFVQDIPYEFVLPKACTGDEDKPCNGNVGYGIYSPVEFMYNLKGDWDTRTVLLFTLLENLGFDAVIFNSYEYSHSMLGINLPLAGDNKFYRGRTFYFWETTNVGWLPGQMPPEWNNVDYWTVVLD